MWATEQTDGPCAIWIATDTAVARPLQPSRPSETESADLSSEMHESMCIATNSLIRTANFKMLGKPKLGALMTDREGLDT